MNIQKTSGRSVTEGLPESSWTMLPPHINAPSNEFVYFAYSAGRIKIGYSAGAAGRIKRLRASGAFPPELVLVMHGRMGDEQDLHIKFSSDRLHGEWFNLSKELRAYLRKRLCDVGQATLDRAELEYRDACRYFLDGFVAPPRRVMRAHCSHGMPLGSVCSPCERERDLAVLKQIKDGTYAR